MNKKNNHIRARLKQIYQSINSIDRWMIDVSLDSFLNNEILQSAVCYQLLIISEAVHNLPDDFTTKYQYSWYKPKAIKSILLHKHFGVDMKMIYHTREKDLPGFSAFINTLIEKTNHE